MDIKGFPGPPSTLDKVSKDCYHINVLWKEVIGHTGKL